MKYSIEYSTKSNSIGYFTRYCMRYAIGYALGVFYDIHKLSV